MAICFTKEEMRNMQKTLELIVEDLRNLFKISGTDEIRYPFETYENGNHYKYDLVLREKDIYIKLKDKSWYTDLALFRKSGKGKICKIEDFTLMFEFFKKYEGIRKGIEEKVLVSYKNKANGIEKINALMNKYSKEATIEVEMPETINQSSIEVIREDGKNIGRINIGPVSIKILTSENVSIISKKIHSKVKKK